MSLGNLQVRDFMFIELDFVHQQHDRPLIFCVELFVKRCGYDCGFS